MSVRKSSLRPRALNCGTIVGSGQVMIWACLSLTFDRADLCSLYTHHIRTCFPPHRLLLGPVSRIDLLNMDRLEALGSQLSQITMYDIKSMYNQVGCFARPDAPNHSHLSAVCTGQEYDAERDRDGRKGVGGDERRAMVRLLHVLSAAASV